MAVVRKRLSTLLFLILAVFLIYYYVFQIYESSLKDSRYYTHRNTLVHVHYSKGAFESFLEHFPQNTLQTDPDIYGPDYAGDAKLIYFTMLNILEAPEPPSSSFTIATQLSLDRVNKLIRLVGTFHGPISAALFISSHEDIPRFRRELNKLKELKPKNLYLHLLFGLAFTPRKSERMYHPYDVLYPINTLRNLAIDQARTDLKMMIDVDFVPSLEVYDAIMYQRNQRYIVQENLVERMKGGAVFVVPAFEYLLEDYKERFGSGWSVTGLLEACRNGHIVPFHSKMTSQQSSSDLDAWCSGNIDKISSIQITKVQGATNFPNWFRLSQPPSHVFQIHQNAYPVLNTSEIDRFYEPYYIVSEKFYSLPVYDERFRGYSFNKRQHSVHLQSNGFKFYVLPSLFLVHEAHRESKSLEIWHRDESVERKVVLNAFHGFMEAAYNGKLERNVGSCFSVLFIVGLFCGVTYIAAVFYFKNTSRIKVK